MKNKTGGKSKAKPPKNAALMNSVEARTGPAIDEATGLPSRSRKHVYTGQLNLRGAAGVVLGCGVSTAEAAAFARESEHK